MNPPYTWTCILHTPAIHGEGKRQEREHYRQAHPFLKRGFRNVGRTGHKKAMTFRRYATPQEEGD